MNKHIELKLKLVEMLAKGAFGLNENCMPLVKQAYDFVADGVDFDKLTEENAIGMSEETAKELSERLEAIVNATKGNDAKPNAYPYSAPYFETALKDGVYYGYNDGHIEMFNGHNENPDDVEYVAFKFGKVSLKVWGQDIRDVKMTTDKKEPCDYITSYSVAVRDFNGANNTKNLLARGLKCKCDGFKRGWYIPALGELYVMYLMKDLLNEALKYVDREPLRDVWYWSSTEGSAAYAWYLSFYDGTFSHYNKAKETSVRPVSAFEPLSF